MAKKRKTAAAKKKRPAAWFVAQRARLARERGQILREIEAETSVLRSRSVSHTSEDADLAEEAQEDEQAAQTVTLLQTRLAEIEEAQARLDDRSYGVCIDCGEPISVQRLAAVPSAVRCAPCQRLFEEKGK